jgi:hypothetical protein
VQSAGVAVGRVGRFDRDDGIGSCCPQTHTASSLSSVFTELDLGEGRVVPKLALEAPFEWPAKTSSSDESRE